VKKRVVIAGLGDTGLLVALNLYPAFGVVGITPKPCLVSGQDLGARLARPDAWRKDFLMAFSRYRRLAGMPLVQGLITGIDTERGQVEVRGIGGGDEVTSYDALVIASGVTNGFWREPSLEDLGTINGRIDRDAEQLRRARTVAVVGAGATGVGVASNLKEESPGTDVHLFFSQSQPLPGYHPKVRSAAEGRLRRQGVVLHPGHRAVLPDGFHGERLTSDAVEWATGQLPFRADVTLWAVGRQRPNSGFVPAAMLDPDGYVRVDEHLRVPGFPNVFAVGDVAASDRNRSSARNAGFLTVAHNVRCHLTGREARMRKYRATPYRWGSIFGVQREGMRVFSPRGANVLIRPWLVEHVLFPWIVRRMIYKGVRD
jgi:NADH dehydrogenase FAD-containing subunit